MADRASKYTLAAPADLSASEMEIDGQTFLLFEWTTAPPPRFEGLSPAEQDVAEGILRCESNAEIARRRGASLRTVANQIAAIFRKLQVRSRFELIARATQQTERSPVDDAKG